MEIKKHLELLGLEVKDKLTDLEGIVNSVDFNLFGCVHADVRPKKLDKDGKIATGVWLNVNRLIITSKKPVMEVPDFIYDTRSSR